MDRGGTRSMLNTNFEKEELEGNPNPSLTPLTHLPPAGIISIYIIQLMRGLRKVTLTPRSSLCSDSMLRNRAADKLCVQLFRQNVSPR